MSADGRYVAFESEDNSLVSRDTFVAGPDIFVRDRVRGVTRLASVLSNGSQPLGGVTTAGAVGNFAPSLSGNGRYVAFYSSERLASNDLNLVYDVYVHDLKSGATRLVSDPSSDVDVRPQVPAGIAGSMFPSISGNGRFVAFQSDQPFLTKDSLGGDVLLGTAIFVRNIRTGITQLVSINSQGDPADDNSFVPQLNATGRYVAFETYATNLSGEDVTHPICAFSSGRCLDVYLFDRSTRRAELISVGRDGRSGDGLSLLGLEAQSVVSANGRFVAFSSTASNLVPNPDDRTETPLINGGVYVLDRTTNRIRRVSVDSFGQGIPMSPGASIGLGPDGRHVVFYSYTPGGTLSTTSEASIHDIATGSTDLVTQAIDQAGPSKVSDVSSSGNGRYVAFSSDHQLTRDDDNEREDIYLCDRGASLGVGHLVTSGRLKVPGESFRSTGRTHALDRPEDSLFRHTEAAEILTASLAHRDAYEDLFVSIDVARLSVPGASIADPPSPSHVAPLIHGLSFRVGRRPYEVRSAPLPGGRFGLFDCTTACLKVAELLGGYGTTGERIVFSLPLKEMGLDRGGRLSRVKAFSALGTFESGAIKILDSIALK